MAVCNGGNDDKSDPAGSTRAAHRSDTAYQRHRLLAAGRADDSLSGLAVGGHLCLLQPHPLALAGLDAGLLYWFLFALPIGYASHKLVTALPRLFQHTGWDVQPLESVRPAEQYTVRYVFSGRQPAVRDRQRIWLRAAQGWVYLEVAAIFIGFVVMIPLFFSAIEFGFGR